MYLCRERKLEAKVDAGVPCGGERARGFGVGDANFKDGNLEEAELTQQSTRKGRGRPEGDLEDADLEDGVVKEANLTQQST